MPDHRFSDFVWNCRRILEEHGSSDHRQEIGVAAIGWQFNPNNARAYKDDVVTIVCEAEPSPALLVIRIENHNPVLCIDRKGDPYRQHGEFTYLEAHVAKLCRQVLAKRLRRMSPQEGGHGIINTDRVLALESLVQEVRRSVYEVGDKRLEDALKVIDGMPFLE